MSTLIRDARVLTLPSPTDLGGLNHHDVLIEDSTIAAVNQGLKTEADEIIEANGRVLMPAFIDAHTHLCWAGDRLDEWTRRLSGASYLELLESGGGIMSTVRAVRAASQAELTELLLSRLSRVLAEGTTTIEIKSGYGLSTEHELKMLGAIADAADRWPGTVVPTACIGHAIDGDHRAFVERTISETLPAVTGSFPGAAIDAYCEQGAWSLDDCLRLFDAAAEAGHSCRVHADQFNELGMVTVAIERGFASVDHLEATGPEGLTALAESDTFGVMLPCSGFHVDGRYADGRSFLDAGGSLVIATNANPGSAPCLSVPAAISLATRHNGLTTAEAITACTRSAADLLGFRDRGFIAPGARADLVLLDETDERELAHTFGGRPTDAVFCAGRRV